MGKNSISSILEEIGTLLELKGENPFKSRAYYNAARTAELLGEEELLRLAREDKLKEVKGIGEALSEKLKELLLTGNMEYYEELKASIPFGLLEMLKLPGLGPRKVKTLYDTLQITTVGELEYACRENRLVNLKGFGAKTQENLLKGIDFLRRSQGLYYFSEARQIGEELFEMIKDLPELVEFSLAGSIRRSREIVKDINLVACTGSPGRFTRFFAELPLISEVLEQGETRAAVELQEGIRTQVVAVGIEQYPYALHYFTGSREHNAAIRKHAESLGLEINENGLFKGKELVRCRDEGELFSSLNLEYIPPELRENSGEIEAAQRGELPELVKQDDIKGIFHVHTSYSDGTNSLRELLNYTREAGYEYIGIADHSQSAYYAGGLKEEDIKRQQEEIEKLREEYPDIGIYSGIESDIKSDGSLDYPDRILKRFDFVIASVHSALKMSSEKMTERLVRALSHPLVTMLGHPTGRLLLGREESPLDMERIFQVSYENNVIMELNASPARLDLDWRYLKRAGELGLLISINPDAHRMEEISYTNYGVAIARKGWLSKEYIFNTRSRYEVNDYLNTY